MRVTAEQSQLNQEKIVDTAARLFMQKGFDGISVADLMKAAGFTHGGFYNRFKSKDDLAAQAVSRAFERRPRAMSKPKDLASYIKSYVSSLHVNRPDAGCPVASLGSDAARQAGDVKRQFETGIEEMISSVESLLVAERRTHEVEARKEAMNLIAKMVGMIVMARALPAGGSLRKELLGVMRDGVATDVGINN